MLLYQLLMVSYRSVGVLVTIRIEYREKVPVVRLGHLSDTRIVTEDQLVQDVRDNSWWYPFPGMYSTLDKYTRISLFVGELHSSDTSAFETPSSGYRRHELWMLSNEGIQPTIDLKGNSLISTIYSSIYSKKGENDNLTYLPVITNLV